MSLVGTNIGKIRIVEQLGAGGMGAVYSGRDETLKREVAVKVIHGDRRLDSEAKTRFMQEARILSQLEHARICRVYDFVEREDSDYLIMERVRGTDLTANRQNLSFAEKLSVAAQIAEALSVAHSQRIAHRDLKPQNVMIGSSGNVKVLDFGLARNFADHSRPDGGAAEGVGQPEEVMVDFGSGNLRMLKPPVQMETGVYWTEQGAVTGTPMFMSPEQARGETTTGASDMYSLGLLLQWLFTGEFPHPKTAVGKILIRSMRGESSPVEGLDADLTSLINRLKSINPETRPTALDTLNRIQWIIDRPKRRMQRFAAGAFILVLIVGTLASTIGFVKARRSEKLAAQAKAEAILEAKNAKETVALFQEFLSSVDPGNKGKDLMVRDLLEAYSQRLHDLQGKPLIQASLFYAYAETYRHLGLYVESSEYAKKSYDLRRAELGEDHPETLDSLNCYAIVESRRGHVAEGERLHRQCVEKLTQLLGRDHKRTLDSLNNLGLALAVQGKFAEAELIFRECLELRTRIKGHANPSTLTSLNNLAAALENQGKIGEAEQLHRRCLKVRQDVLGNKHPDTLDSLNNLACTKHRQGQFAEAEGLQRQCLEARRQVLGDEHPDTLDSLDNLGLALLNQGKFAEAEVMFVQFLDIVDPNRTLDHPKVVGLLDKLGHVLTAQGKLAEAEPLHRRSLDIQVRALGREHGATLSTMNGLAQNLLNQKVHLAEAEQLARDCVQLSLRSLGEGHISIAVKMDTLANVLEAQGQLQDAVEWYRKAAKRGNEHAGQALKRLGGADPESAPN